MKNGGRIILNGISCFDISFVWEWYVTHDCMICCCGCSLILDPGGRTEWPSGRKGITKGWEVKKHVFKKIWHRDYTEGILSMWMDTITCRIYTFLRFTYCFLIWYIHEAIHPLRGQLYTFCASILSCGWAYLPTPTPAPCTPTCTCAC